MELDAACAGVAGGRGVIGGGGGGVTAGTEMGVCDETNAFVAGCAGAGAGTNGLAAGIVGVAGGGALGTDGHGERGVGRSGGSVAGRAGVGGLCRPDGMFGATYAGVGRTTGA